MTKIKESIEFKKNQLKSEILLAKRELQYNLRTAKVQDYLSIDVPTNLIGQLGLNGVEDALSKTDMLTRTALAPDNFIRKIVKYLKIFSKAAKILTD